MDYTANSLSFGKKRGVTLKKLQAIARKNKISIYKKRKGGRGYTKTPLTMKSLKTKLSRARVSYTSSPRRGRKSTIRRRKPTAVNRTYGNVPLSMQMDDSDLSVFGKRLKMTKKAIAARRAYRRKSPKRGRRSPRRGRKMSKTRVRAMAAKAMRLRWSRGISLKQAWKIVQKKSGFGALSHEGIGDLEDELGLRFGMSTVCRPGYSPNRRWRAGKGSGQKRCSKDRVKKITLNQLQSVAVSNGVNIYKSRAGGGGYTRTPLTSKALKSRLSRARVSYDYGRNSNLTYV